MKYLPSLFALLMLLSLQTQAQDTIYLQNPSFETAGTNCNEMPAHWKHCGSSDELPPSAQPGCLDVNQIAFHGQKYMSLLTRKNENNDRICQWLPENSRLQQDSLYKIRVHLAHATHLRMPAGKGKRKVRHSYPTILRVTGYNSQDNQVELLATTPVIDHTDWRGYDLVFRPAHGTYDVILFEAFFNWQDQNTTNGNLLIDSISPIVKISMADGLIFRSGRPIALKNASLEDPPQCCKAPWGWTSCGPAEESPPDIQPGSFTVDLPAAHGQTYVSLVVRDNNTTESMGTRLSEPLKSGQSYSLKAELARTDRFMSLSRSTGAEANYATPVKLRVWGGNSECDRVEMLVESILVNNTRWIDYEFVLSPQKQDYSYLILEAYYKTPVLFPYNGNLLIDNLRLSHLIK